MPANVNLALIFLTGLTTGGLTCLVTQGGLLASTLSDGEGRYQKTVAFVGAKLVAYTVVGALLGFFGSVVSLSSVARGIMQIMIGIYLIGIAGSMLELHPFFRYFVIKPPKFLARLVRNQTKTDHFLTPVILGSMTVLLPCATTQAMEVIALGTGNPLWGALIMLAFVLGTTPLFVVLGFIYTKGSEMFKGVFNKVAAVLMIAIALVTINSGLILAGSIYTFQNFIQAAATPIEQSGGGLVKEINGKQEVVINVGFSGYTPNEITIKKGIPTVVKLITNGSAGCARAFTIPSLGIEKLLPASGEETVEFTPNKMGALVFSCSMGMYTGKFNVI